jgi:peptidoglycan/LPS O-acetylase OafA/YrhL
MRFTGVQLLRFSAAMLVAAMHITQAISVHLTGQGAGHLGLSEPLAVGLLTALLVVLCACLSYALLERPTTLSLQRELSRQRPPAATPSTSPDHSASRPFTHAP